jgi:hypothetical protein
MPFLIRLSARHFRRWASIIGALLLVLGVSGCSAVRLGYSTAPNLAYWWLDGYFDFDNTQTARLRTDLQSLHAWHRADELPLYAEVLKNLQASAAQPVNPEQVCNLYGYLQTRVQAISDRFAPTLATLAPTLQPAQLEHIAREFDKRNRQWREEWLDGTPAERFGRRVKQLVERAETFYGGMEAAQLAAVRTHVAESGFDAAVNYRETLRRQQDALQTLRDLRAPSVTDIHALAEMRALIARSLASPDPAYREYADRLTTQSCAAVAAIHNSTTPAQRNKLAQTLQNYGNDVRALSNR